MKGRIPQFKSLEHERRFWQRHDVTDFLTELTPVKLTFTRPRRPTPVSVKLTGFEARVLQSILARLSGTHPQPTLSPRKS